MSFFNTELPILKEKVVSHHPWEKYIKDAYSHTYKYGHNSANNPVYPPKKEKPVDANRVKVTVIGSRVTKEFIYCMKVAQGLYKYRKQHFEAPVIRGVNSVEWPKVWNDLKIQYGGMAFCLRSRVAVIVNDQFIGGEKEFRQLVETKFSYYVYPDYYDEAIKLFSDYIKSSGRPCAYLQILLDDENIGTLLFTLYSDIVPQTCENFLRLCTTKKGGYAGTPVHRIVKDCWIQCGGFGLNSTDLDCENFIVPHDRRGVLCMANNGRHVDCSTQFFVLLQPAPWMAFKYVAFGQLIDGEETLQQIEQVPTCYESPTKNITIHKCGVFNMDCKAATINKKTNEYIQGHVENLFSLAELLYEALMEKVFLEVEFREMQRLQKEMAGEGQEGTPTPTEEPNLRTTERFMRKKEDIDKQLQKAPPQATPPRPRTAEKGENNDFDVEVYSYEPEEYSYKQDDDSSTDITPEPDKPFYIPLTDVPYPDDVDSTYDFKKVLKGDYCVECDIDKHAKKKRRADSERLSYPSELFDLLAEKASASSSQATLDSEDEKEIQKYLKNAADRVSFAGGIVKTMAKGGKLNLFENARKSELITDEELRRFRLASVDLRGRDKQVSISVPGKDQHREIKRRQTGYVRPEDLARIKQIQKANADLEEEPDEDDDYSPYTRQVSVGVPVAEAKEQKKANKQRFAHTEELEKVRVFDKQNAEMGVDEDEEIEEEEEEQSLLPDTPQLKDIEKQKKLRMMGTVRSGSKSNESEIGERGVEEEESKEDGRPKANVTPATQQKWHHAQSHPRDSSRFEGFEDSDQRPSVLARLYDDYVPDEDDIGRMGPTLKDYKPLTEGRQKQSLFLTISQTFRNSDEDIRDKYVRRSLIEDEKTVTQVLDLQHGKQVGRKISSDYVKTIDHLEHVNRLENSLRSIEFAKKRPALSVHEYKKRNQEYQEEHLLLKSELGGSLASFKPSITEHVSKKRRGAMKKKSTKGLRLSGDTPLSGSFSEDK